MKKFRFMIILMVIFVLILASCTSAAVSEPTTQAPVKLRISGSTNISNAPLYLARDAGYFVEQNLDVEFVPFERSTDAIAMLATGDLDVYAGGMGAALITAIGSEGKIAVVADKGNLGTSGCSYTSILIRKDLYDSGEVTEPSQFAGRKMEANPSGFSGYLASKFLQTGGLDLDDVEITSLPSASIPDAFATGALDALSEVEPWLSLVLNSGYAKVWAEGNKILPGVQVGLIAYGPSLIKDNPDAGIRFMTAYLKGVQKYNEGKTPDNLEKMAAFSELTIDDINLSCLPTISEDGQIQFAGVDDFQQWSLERDLIELTVTEAQFWNPYFVEQAYPKLK